MNKRTRKYIINTALILILTFAVIYFSVKDDYEEVVKMLASVKLGWLLVCLSMALLYHIIVGYILKTFARMYNPQYRLIDGCKNAYIAALFHGLTPFSSGGQFVQAYVFFKQKIKVSDSASILLMDFIVYQSTLVVFTAVLILLRFHHIVNARSLVFQLALFGFLVNFIVIVSLILLAKGKRLHYFITHHGISFLAKLRIVKNPEEKLQKLQENVDRFRVEMVRLRDNKTLMLKVIAANVVRLTIYNSIPYAALLSLGIVLDFGGWLDLVALSAFVGMVNAFIPSPGATGGTEGTYVLMFQDMFSKLTKSVAVGSMLIWRFSTYYLVMFVGLAAFLLFNRKQPIRKIEEEIYENRSVQ